MANDSHIAQTATEARRCLLFAPFKIIASTKLETGTAKLLLLKSIDSQNSQRISMQDENLCLNFALISFTLGHNSCLILQRHITQGASV